MRPTRGRFRHKLTIQAKTETDNDISGVTPTWADFVTVFAERMEYQTGTERFGTGREVAAQIVTWQTNWRSDITQKMRIKRGAEDYNIKGLRDPDGLRRSLLIDTEYLPEGFGT